MQWRDVKNSLVKILERGTAFIISADGYALTCSHIFKVLDKKLPVEFQGEEIEAEIIFKDDDVDFAIIKLSIKKQTKNLISNIKFDTEPRIGIDSIVQFEGFTFIENIETDIVRGNLIDNEYSHGGKKYILIDNYLKKGMSGSPVYHLVSKKIIGMAKRKIHINIKDADGASYKRKCTVIIPIKQIIDRILRSSKISKFIKSKIIISLGKATKNQLQIDNNIRKKVDEDITGIDNYNDIMRKDVKKSQYFRMLEPSAIRGSVFHIDIEQNKVIRIENLIEDIKKIIYEENKWILLSGGSGLSKTTSSKIIAHDLNIENILIRFENELYSINKLSKKIKNSKNKILLIIDDLHRNEYGAISEKLAALVPLLQNNNIKILSTSRLSLKRIKIECTENLNREHEAADKFEEIKIKKYYEELDNAMNSLIEKILSENNYSNEEIDLHKNYLISNYKADFVSLGFALLPIIKKKSIEIDENSIIIGIQQFLLNEFNEIINHQNINLRTLLRVFIGTCYNSLVDEPTTVDCFNTEKDSRKNIWIALNAFEAQGLFIKAQKWIGYDIKHKKREFIFGLNHAKVAEMYLKSLKIGFWIKNQTFEWRELCSLSSFKPGHTKLEVLEDFCYSFRNLTKLDLSMARLSFLPTTIKHLKNLKELNLENNNLKHLPESFGELLSLKILKLNYNPLKSLPESFGNLKSLQELYMDFTNIQSFPKSFSNLKSLKIFSFRGDFHSRIFLRSLPDSFGYLKSLAILDLQDHKLEDLPNSFGNLESLEELNLIGNIFKSLPESFGNLRSIKKLYLNANHLETLPECICKLNSLKKLNLSWNKLKNLPDAIGNLKSLRSLDLRFNKIEMLPESFKNLKLLKKLDLEFACLKEIPEFFNDLESIKILNIIGGNDKNFKIEMLPETLNRLDNLQYLNLQNNNIKVVPETFCCLKSLKELNLAYNPLEKLPKCLLNSNSLTHLIISEDQFKNITKLTNGFYKFRISILDKYKLKSLADFFRVLL